MEHLMEGESRYTVYIQPPIQASRRASARVPAESLQMPDRDALPVRLEMLGDQTLVAG
jgi:hypothetical protein